MISLSSSSKPRRVNRKEKLDPWWDKPIDEAEMNVLADELAKLFDMETRGVSRRSVTKGYIP